MALTKLQEVVRQSIQDGKSILLIAPTGIGKTLAVLSHLSQSRGRVVFGLPLRALAGTILEEASALRRNGCNIDAVIHHGDVQDSWLLSEEVVVTTYDQLVCAVPGLPLSLPASAGHAVAGALLMSTMVLDEVHLAWSISREALTILLGIIEFRQKFGLQTVVMTATMPKSVAREIADRLGLTLIVAGECGAEGDEGLQLREKNRHVCVTQKQVKDHRREGGRVDTSEVSRALVSGDGKRIYFANTVQRLQRVYDELLGCGLEMDSLTVLHNRMPRSVRNDAEGIARQRFGKGSSDGSWLLLTNQVAEAGLDISAPFVLSDPAPVDTLIQRAGRCARWFRQSEVRGRFEVIAPPKTKLKDWAVPYSEASVELTVEKLTELLGRSDLLDWDFERAWIDAAWLGCKKELDRKKSVEECLDRTAFALNLFDRASQERSPGAIASAFREILSVQVAVSAERPETADANLLSRLKAGFELESCAVSLNTGYALLSKSKGDARLVRQREEYTVERRPAYVTVGDVLIVPPTVAYLHPKKGLCFCDDSHSGGDALESRLMPPRGAGKSYESHSNPQSLWSHTQHVMERVEGRLLSSGDYRATLIKILERLETCPEAADMADAIGRLAILATGLHDIGKCDKRWQRRAHEIDPDSKEELIGRTRNTTERMGVPHTPPAFPASVAACKAAVGDAPRLDQLVRVVSLAAARHHSSMLDPSALTFYAFDPLEGATTRFIEQVLSEVGLTIRPEVIVDAARTSVSPKEVPLILPNDDLFPIYALVGRAILVSDREDAAGRSLESWSS